MDQVSNDAAAEADRKELAAAIEAGLLTARPASRARHGDGPVSSWTAERLPITVAPLPGEALESWIAAYARRLHTTGSGLIAHLGLGGSRIAHMALRLHDHEAAALERATGVSRQALAAMTLQPHDGLAIAITPGRRALASRFPIGRFGTGRTRYCPQCLAHYQGRGPVTWRLPWSFACPLHRVLLLDFCPACRRPPSPGMPGASGPRTGGACTRDNPASAARRGGCGTDLTAAEAVPLPAGGLVLAAHQHLASLMTSPPGSRPAAVTELREVYATAWRVAARPACHSRAGPAGGARRAGRGRRGVALAGRCRARATTPAPRPSAPRWPASRLIETHPEHEELFGWILQADRSLMKNRPYIPGIGAVARTVGLVRPRHGHQGTRRPGPRRRACTPGSATPAPPRGPAGPPCPPGPSPGAHR